MAKRKTRKATGLLRVSKKRKKYAKRPVNKVKARKSGFIIKRRRISNARLERGLRVLTESNDLTAAARAIRLSPEKFKRVAKRKGTIRKRGKRWTVASRLPRRMPIFTDSKQLAITVHGRAASQIGRYMSAVGEFLRKNNPSILNEFVKRGVKDTRGRFYVFETNPNVLYRLSSAGGEPFEEIYRIVI